MTDRPQDKKPDKGLWRKVDSSIWDPGSPPTRLERAIEKILAPLRFLSIWVVMVATPLFAFITFLVAYSIAGPVFFGPVVLTIWAGMLVGFVVVMEKTGHAKHWEGKTFKLSLGRLLAIPFAFAVIVGILYLMLFLLHKI